ncbi:hypothetical protein FOB22_005865 [Saccharomyces cerevisiae]|nr:hypothetical protein FOB22_005865 [Saccharomyces cerevisiae]
MKKQQKRGPLRITKNSKPPTTKRGAEAITRLFNFEQENISAANELIQNRLNMEMLDSQAKLPNPDASLPKADLREDLERTISRNNEVMRENGQLEERITELQAEIDELININKEQVSTASLLERDSKAKGRKGWTGFKKVFK